MRVMEFLTEEENGGLGFVGVDDIGNVYHELVVKKWASMDMVVVNSVDWKKVVSNNKGMFWRFGVSEIGITGLVSPSIFDVMDDELLRRVQEEMEEDLFGTRQLPLPDLPIHTNNNSANGIKNEGYNHKAKESSSNEGGSNITIIVAGKTDAKGINFTKPHVHDPPCPYCSVRMSK
ncbi:hypothetical protein SASPL_101363 [Salvia splendens]|uniref:Uncharacterized protein n=1 Tax=Salvia splendens TaxID=180675 RepID=A0A8X8YRR1_SALSN|nr:hypothetical protein SASPL_101363 [Salvia splendens]